jgi:hypothetical protein
MIDGMHVYSKLIFILKQTKAKVQIKSSEKKLHAFIILQ